MKMLKMCLQPNNVSPFPDLPREDIVPETVLSTVAAPLSSSDLLFYVHNLHFQVLLNIYSERLYFFLWPYLTYDNI